MMLRVLAALAVAVTLLLAVMADNYVLATIVAIGVVAWTTARNILRTRQDHRGWQRID